MRTVDLFAGCGGMSLGFQAAGFDIVSAFENWSPAIETYRNNFDHPVHDINLGDVELASSLIGELAPQVIVGGPPCQDFSIAGLGVEASRANLTMSFAEIVVNVRPEIFVMENVYNIERSNVLPDALELFKHAGYGLTSHVIDASLVGVPQKRKRYFLIGRLDAPDETCKEAIENGLSESSTTVFDYFGHSLGTEFYYAHPRNYKRRGVFSIYEPSSTIRRVNRPIPATYKMHSADKAPVNNGVRPLTTSERAQIQTFPKSFCFCGSKSQIEQQIGNAVPVRLAEYVASCIRETELSSQTAIYESATSVSI